MLPGPQILSTRGIDLRAVGQGRDSLGAAAAEDAVGACDGGGRELHVRYAAIRRRGADDDHVLDAGDLGRHDGVEHRGRIGRLRAGRVEADGLDCAYLDAEAVVLHVGGQTALELLLVVGAHAASRELQGGSQGRLDALEGGFELLVRHFEAFVGNGAIEALGVASDGGVALAAHVGDDAPDVLSRRRVLADGGAAFEDGASGFFCAANDVHGFEFQFRTCSPRSIRARGHTSVKSSAPAMPVCLYA